MRYAIVNPTNESRSKIISPVKIVNFYPQVENQRTSKNVASLIRTPGYRLVQEINTDGVCRAAYTSSTGRCFFIVYNKLHEMDTNESFTVRGTLSTTSGNCQISDNGTELFIVDGTYGYTMQLASPYSFLTITDGDFPSSPTHCIFTDGYSITNEGSTGKFWFSNSYDSRTWDSLDFATAEYSSDALVGITKTSNGTIWMIGRYSYELWQNVGNPDLPWQRIPGAIGEIGCVAPYSIATDGNNVFFLGNGSSGYASVYLGRGYETQKISTHAIEYQLKQLTSLENAVGFTYSDEGHDFYVLSVTSQATYVYDLTTNMWHERGTYNANTGLNGRNIAQWHCFFNKKHYVGHYNDSNIYEMSMDELDEAGNTIKREIITPHINNENKYLKHRKIEMDMKKGLGLVGGSEPEVVMQFSNDGGNSYSDEAWSTAAEGAGEIGEYTTRVKWQRLGIARDRVYKFTFTDAVDWTISGAYVEVS